MYTFAHDAAREAWENKLTFTGELWYQEEDGKIHYLDRVFECHDYDDAMNWCSDADTKYTDGVYERRLYQHEEENGGELIATHRFVIGKMWKTISTEGFKK